MRLGWPRIKVREKNYEAYLNTKISISLAHDLSSLWPNKLNLLGLGQN